MTKISNWIVPTTEHHTTKYEQSAKTAFMTQVSIRDTFVVEGNTPSLDDTLLFVVERSDDLTSFSLNYSTFDSTATWFDQDYPITMGTISFVASSGTLTDTIKIPVFADDKTELDEILQVRLSNIINLSGTTSFGDSIGLGTIINNDTSFLSIRDTTIIEGNAGGIDSLCYIVDWRGDIDTSFNYSFTTMDSSATLVNNDYTSMFGLLTGSGTGMGTGTGVGIFLGIDTIKVAVNGDNKTEKDEVVKVLLSSINAGNRSFFFLNNDSTGLGNIINDDASFITIRDTFADEGANDTLRFTVTVDNPVDSLGIVYITMDSTATASLDFIGTSSDTIYLHCSSTATIKIPLLADDLVEIDEIVKVKLIEILPNDRVVSFQDSIGIGIIQNKNFDPSIADPCDCLRNESSSGAGDGQFSETVQVTSQSGETWYISSVTGLFRPPTGSFPPAKGGTPYSLIPFTTGISGHLLTEIPLGNGLSQYQLNGIHVDGTGYTIYVTNGIDVLTIGNLCHYETACDADQTIVIPHFQDIAGFAQIRDCNANNKFINDGIHLYQDSTARYNEMTICPNINGQTLTVTFQKFDLAAGDSLAVYDGIDTTANFIAKGSGNSVSFMNGGWVTSNCDPTINPSGCLTFAFATNGDNQKGAGWEATVNCFVGSGTTLNPVNNLFASAKCDSFRTSVNINIPTISQGNTNCTISNDDIIVSYCDVIDTLNAGQLTTAVFPFGTYDINYKLLADTTISTSNQVHVALPGLSCNDTIISAIGQGCVVEIQPDDILEGPCDTNGVNVNQLYMIRVKTDTGFVIGTGTDFPLLNAGTGGNVQCNQFYEVTIFRTLEVNHLGCRQVITDSCTTTLKLIDGIKPVFTALKNDTLFGCFDQSLSQDMLTPPTVIDNCEIDRVIASIPMNNGVECDTNQTIAVTWTAYDLCGNSSTAIQMVSIRRPQGLILPVDTLLAPNESVNPSLIGWPRIDLNGSMGNIITPDTPYCNFNLMYEDEIIPGVCGKESNIMRIFTLLDNCKNVVDPIFKDTQFILIRDTIAPTIFCPSANEFGSINQPYLFLTNFNDCSGIANNITPPTGLDEGGDDLEAVLVGIYRANNNILVASSLEHQLPTGEYRADYTLKDDCGNVSEVCAVYFNIVDRTLPTAICSDELIISLTFGNVRITPDDISIGSFDACGIDTMFIRRSICGSETDFPTEINAFVADRFATQEDANGWTSSIEIGCCDMNTAIKVQLLVFDKNGNSNKCWIIVNTENQPQSVCGNLPDAIDYCDNLKTTHIGEPTDANGNRDFDDSEWQPIDPIFLDIINEQFGSPSCDASAVCVNNSIEQEYQLIKDICGIQMMRRRFRTRSFDAQTIYPWFHQNITINYRPNWSFTFPPDTTLECGTTNVGNIPEMPLIVNRGTCDQIGWEVKDEVFETEDGACFKVLRQWSVINGCQHADVQNPFSLPRDQVNGKVLANSKRTFNSSESVNGVALNSQGFFTYTQVIVVMDTEAPIITIGDVDTCIISVPDSAPLNEADNTPGMMPFECDTVRLFSASGMDCTANEQLNFSYQIFDGNLRIGFGEGSSFYHIVEAGKTYRVVFTASDNCGNIGQTERLFTFRDCQRPTPICQDRRFNLGAGTTATVSTNDINFNSFDNCTPSSNLDFRIWHAATGIAEPITITDVLNLPTSIALGCESVGISTARLYVIDEAQSFSFCTSIIQLDDTLLECPLSRPIVSGSIQSTIGEMVEDVEVRVEGEGEMPQTITTSTDGNYSYTLQSGKNYQIRPKKDKNPLNGVSTFDLVLIQKHILGTRTFESPYHYIAADINQSGAISAFDMVILRQLILNIIPDFPNNDSWRFVNTSYPMNTNPILEGYLDYHQVDNISKNEQINFTAVKIGDVNGTARPNSLVNTEERNFNGSLDLHVTNQYVEKGKRYTVNFSSHQFKEILGYQFTLQFGGLHFEDWTGGNIGKNHFGFSLAKRGFITTSWNQSNTSITADNLFQLEFTATENGWLSDMIDINSTYTVAEAYNEIEELLAVQLIFDQANSKDKFFKLYQNQPNPFRQQTSIHFYLPETSLTTFSIMDITGKVITQRTQHYSKGEHTIRLDRKELPSKGLFYYQLSSSAGKQTKSMLILD